MPRVIELTIEEAAALAEGVDALYYSKGMQKEKIFYKKFPFVKTNSAKISLTTAEGRAAADKILKAIESYYQPTPKEKRGVLSSDLSEDELQFIESEWQRYDEAKLTRYLETSARLAWMLQMSFKDQLKSGLVDLVTLKTWKDVYNRAGWKSEEIDVLGYLMDVSYGDEWAKYYIRQKTLQSENKFLSREKDTHHHSPVLYEGILNIIKDGKVTLRVITDEELDHIIKGFNGNVRIFLKKSEIHLEYRPPGGSTSFVMDKAGKRYIEVFMSSGEKHFLNGFTSAELTQQTGDSEAMVRKNLSLLRSFFKDDKDKEALPFISDGRTAGRIKLNYDGVILWYTSLPKKDL